MSRESYQGKLSVRSDAVFVIAGSARSETTQNVNLPANWLGEDVEAYLGFISQDGREVANSVYLGTVTVA